MLACNFLTVEESFNFLAGKYHISIFYQIHIDCIIQDMNSSNMKSKALEICGTGYPLVSCEYRNIWSLYSI